MLSVHAHRPAGWPHFVKSVCNLITDGQNLQVRPRVSGQPHSSVCSGLFFLFLFLSLLLGAPSYLLPCRDLNSCLLDPRSGSVVPSITSKVLDKSGFPFPPAGRLFSCGTSTWSERDPGWTNTHLSMLLSMQPTVLRCGPGEAASGIDKAS